MKVALAFDYILARGGMEHTLIVLARALRADIWTTTYKPECTYPELRELPVFSNPLRFHKRGFMHTEALLRFRRMDLSDYDIILTMGDWAKQVGVRRENHPQIHYDTPIRMVYDLYRPIKNMLSPPAKIAFTFWVQFIKKLDLQAATLIDLMLAPSETVRERIRKYYGKDGEVVWAPVSIKKFRYRPAKDYFLSVQRITTTKGLELQLETFKRLQKEKLIIVGSVTEPLRSYWEELKRRAPPNVIFKESVSDEELVQLYSECKAVLQTSMDEDLGKVPIEAMASGKPCIAIKEGGFKETIIHGKTGILVDKPYLENLVNAIQSLDDYKFEPSICRKRAEFFSEDKFVRRIKKILSRVARGEGISK
jgi:glycosyltransferase involved in cell wall biosynthesis